MIFLTVCTNSTSAMIAVASNERQNASNAKKEKKKVVFKPSSSIHKEQKEKSGRQKVFEKWSEKAKNLTKNSSPEKSKNPLKMKISLGSCIPKKKRKKHKHEKSEKSGDSEKFGKSEKSGKSDKSKNSEKIYESKKRKREKSGDFEDSGDSAKSENSGKSGQSGKSKESNEEPHKKKRKIISKPKNKNLATIPRQNSAINTSTSSLEEALESMNKQMYGEQQPQPSTSAASRASEATEAANNDSGNESQRNSDAQGGRPMVNIFSDDEGFGIKSEPLERPALPRMGTISVFSSIDLSSDSSDSEVDTKEKFKIKSKQVRKWLFLFV